MRRLEFTGEVINGIEAHQLGVAQWVVPDDQLQDFALDLARRVSALDTGPIGALKARIDPWID